MQWSWTPPAGGEDPLGIGVKERPRQNRRGYNEQAENLVAAVGSGLSRPVRLLGHLLKIGLDAALNHGFAIPVGSCG